MKTPKPIVVKSVSGAVAASILVSSCLPGYDFDDSYYGPHADNLTHGESFFELSESNLSEEFFHKLKAIQQIVETVLIDKKEARQFANNPTEYVASKEIHFNVVLHEAERRLLFAFADDDILKAVKMKNIETFLALCSEKGYIGVINEENKPENIRAMFKTDEDYEEFMHLIENLDGYNPTTRAVAGVPVVVVAGALIFVGAAVIYAAAAGITVGAGTVAAYETGVAVNQAVYVNSETSVRSSAMEVNEPVLRIWTENNGLISSDAFYTEMIDKQVNLLMELIEKEFPISVSALDAVRDILKFQLEGYYGLRK